MAAFTTERKAAKPHKCWRCGGPVNPGERYISVSIPPGGDLGYERWTRLAEHLSYVDCESALDADAKRIPDAPNSDLSDWPVPLDANGQYAGESKEA